MGFKNILVEIDNTCVDLLAEDATQRNDNSSLPNATKALINRDWEVFTGKGTVAQVSLLTMSSISLLALLLLIVLQRTSVTFLFRKISGEYAQTLFSVALWLYFL
ncbi:hypothetical protein M5689_000896 [Euphorbia peplus]|nr:hypothetical protein M5689_000896 [Euphorbia peplus]